MKQYIELIAGLFSRWFHKRNIIIISERRVKHIPISGHLQFVTISLFMVGVCWGSYSTGSFMAARSALKEQGQALRSVTNAHIENSFNTVYKSNTPTTDSIDVGPYKRSAPSNNIIINGPAAALSVLDKAKLVERISLLESKVIELKTTNETIVQRVQDKTTGRLENLESIIKQTGLKESTLRKQYEEKLQKTKTASRRGEPSAGGPYIPEDTIALSPQAKEMLSDLDQLVILSQIVSELPLDVPVKDAEYQSGFGHRIDPFNGHLAFHSGLDLSAPAGAKIYSAADGKVIASGHNGSYGNAIDIEHSFGITTRYGHLSKILVKEGQPVKKGDVIGVQGSTGRSTGAHLHYEVRYNDRALNPKNFLEAGRHVHEE